MGDEPKSNTRRGSRLTEETLRRRDSEDSRSCGKRTTDISPPRSERSHRTAGTSSTTTSMLDVKNSRKRAEADLQLLANRLALLRTEEQKAIMKMNETKSRANEILQIKKRNEDVKTEKVTHYAYKELATNETRERVERDREERRKKISQHKDIIQEARRHEAKETKQEARKYEEDVIQQRIALEDEKRKKAAEEKRRRDIVRQQREKEKADKERDNQLEHARRMAEETKRTEDAEKMIQQMEEEERALIERLKQTQIMQREAYETLQRSLDV